jgi:hypothetical protein
MNMSQSEEAVYKSRRTWRSLWQEYRVYRDRVELESWLTFHTIRISINEIEEIKVCPRFAVGDLFREGLVLALKLDMADVCRHVALRKQSGFIKYIKFTPDDADRFVEVCRSIMSGS